MTEENKSCECECCGSCDASDKKWWKHHGRKWRGGGGMGGIWFAGFIGALFYFLQNVSGFLPVLTGIVKALFWPAFVVFKALELLKV